MAEGRYHYEATVRLIIKADSADAAYRAQQSAVRYLRTATVAEDSPVVAVHGFLMDLNYRPDLNDKSVNADGSYAVASSEEELPGV